MTKAIRIMMQFLIALCVPLFGASADSFEQTEQRVKQHAEKMLQRHKGKESAVKSTLEREQSNWKSKTYHQQQGAEEHPWLKSGSPRGVNPNSKSDYKADSKNAWDTPNFLTETWSCFEPQLVAYADCPMRTKGVTWDAADMQLLGACWIHCCLEEFMWNPWPDPQGDTFYESSTQEKFEVVQFWLPENQASINNYGRMRVNPMDLTGEQKEKFLRDRLVQDKRRPDRENQDNIAKEVDEGLPTEQNKLQNQQDPDWRQDPFKGQYQMRTGSGSSIDHLAAHVYRTHLSSQWGDERPNTRNGWKKELKTIFDAGELNTQDKYQLNIWTEYDYFDYLTSVDTASFTIRNDEKNRSQRFMQALLRERTDWIKRAKEENPFYQNTGEAAYRVAKWNQFEPLKKYADIQGDNNQVLKEVVYFNGLALYPLVNTYEGFMVPELTIRANAARKAFEIAGNRELAKKFPGREKSRMRTYTISDNDKSREIDKIQRIYPLNPDGKPQECHRSQKAPNMLQQTEDSWSEKQFRHDLMGYVKEDNHDSAHIYWNKRVACTCRQDANSGYGSQVMNWVPDGLGPGRGDGDRIYGRFERTLCTYKEGELPSAFAGEDRPQCDKPNYGQRKVYQGLQDDVSSSSHK